MLVYVSDLFLRSNCLSSRIFWNWSWWLRSLHNCPLFYWREVRIAGSILQPTSDHMVTPLPTESQRENGLLIRERYLPCDEDVPQNSRGRRTRKASQCCSMCRFSYHHDQFQNIPLERQFDRKKKSENFCFEPIALFTTQSLEARKRQVVKKAIGSTVLW